MMRLITPTAGSPSSLPVSWRSSANNVAPRASAAISDSPGRAIWVPSLCPVTRLPRLVSVRTEISCPASRCASRAPAAPIATSPGCAPMASTACRPARRAARPLAVSETAEASSRSGRTGFCRNSSARFRSARTALSACSWAVITAMGRSGESLRSASRNSRPVMPGSSASVRTRSQAAEPTCRSATAGSGVCVTSNPPRLPSTCIAKWAATASSSTRRIRPGWPSCPVLAMHSPWA